VFSIIVLVGLSGCSAREKPITASSGGMLFISEWKDAETVPSLIKLAVTGKLCIEMDEIFAEICPLFIVGAEFIERVIAIGPFSSTIALFCCEIFSPDN
ncbi:MAG: hypothetical protein WCE65_09630, partial [Methanoregula sp.]